MKKYELLKNKVYLYLLAFYDDEIVPSSVALAKNIGISRQTASKKMKDLQEEGLIVIEDKIIQVDNVFNIDIKKLRDILNNNPNYTLQTLVNELIAVEDSKWSPRKISVYCNVSEKHLEQEENKDDKCIIYGIMSEGVIKYVGSTDNFTERKDQHIRKRPFLNYNSFIVLKEVSPSERFQVEKEMIQTLKPEWNIMSK